MEPPNTIKGNSRIGAPVAEPTEESIELEDSIKLAFQSYFPNGHPKKKVALLKAVMHALVVYIINDKRKLLEGMKRAHEEKIKAELEASKREQ